MVHPEWIPNSRRALEASEYAREESLHETFHQAVFRRFYGEGQDIGSWSVLRAAAEEVGLDPEEMQSRTEQGEFSPIVTESVQRAQALGITGVPTYVFNDRYAIVGAQPFEAFERLMARLKEEDLDMAG